MPSASTFTVEPIARLIARYVPAGGKGWADPFAGYASPAEFTNDLNPDCPAAHHLDAREFVPPLPSLDGVLFDPPYSPRQISEVYQKVGMAIGIRGTQNGRLYSEVRALLAPKVRPGGYALSFGWNSTGFGKDLGFEPIEYLLVCHGGAHNDTICVVERKVIGHLMQPGDHKEANLG